MARKTQELVFVGIKGNVVALNRGTGQEVWRTHLKGASFVNVTVERGLVLAGTRGEVFSLNPATGRIAWSNPLKGLGYGIIGFATCDSAAAATEQMAQDDAAAAAAAAAASSA